MIKKHIDFSNVGSHSQIIVSETGDNWEKIDLCPHIMINCVGVCDDPENERLTVTITCKICHIVFLPTFETKSP